MKAEVAFPTPAVMGHEITGTVAALGPGVAGPPVGTPVASAFIMPCGFCGACASGRDDLCDNFFAMNRLRGTFVPIHLAHLLADLSERVPESEIQARLALEPEQLRNYLALADYTEPQEPHVPRGGADREDRKLVEVVVVATKAQGREIEERLEDLTEGDEDRTAKVLADVARAHLRGD